MGKRLTILATAALIWACGAGPAPAKGLNVAVFGDGAGPATFSEQSPTFRRARQTIESRLIDAGYNVFDSDATQPSMDVAVYLSVHASESNLTYATRITTWIAGRLVLVGTGRRLDLLEFEAPPRRRAPGACDRRCVLELVAADAEVLAGKLGNGIAEKLGAVAATRPIDTPVKSGDGARIGYTLVIEGFSSEEAARVEEYLVVFPGYVRHRLRSVQAGRREHRYETDASRGQVEKSLAKMLRHLGVGARIAAAGDRITVNKTVAAGPGPANANDW
jgi:hypothetical protein